MHKLSILNCCMLPGRSSNLVSLRGCREDFKFTLQRDFLTSDNRRLQILVACRMCECATTEIPKTIDLDLSFLPSASCPRSRYPQRSSLPKHRPRRCPASLRCLFGAWLSCLRAPLTADLSVWIVRDVTTNFRDR